PSCSISKVRRRSACMARRLATTIELGDNGPLFWATGIPRRREQGDFQPRSMTLMWFQKEWAARIVMGVGLALSVSCNQGPPWESYAEAGKKAYREGNLAEAERQFSQAVKKAEQFGPEDTRLATSLNNLGETLRSEGKLIEAEPMYKRALA